MPQYENSNPIVQATEVVVGAIAFALEAPEWRPSRKSRSLPRLEWTAADERRFLAKKARQEEVDEFRTVGQIAQRDNPDVTPAEALIAWAFKK
jgi:hypothetical protein